MAGAYDSHLDLLIEIFEGPEKPEDDPEYYEKLAARDAFQRLVVNMMGKDGLDALVFPCVQVVPPTKQAVRDGKHEVLSFPTNTLIASQTWMPSICMPAGFTDGGLPVGIEIVVPPYAESDLFRFGSAFERVSPCRQAPTWTET